MCLNIPDPKVISCLSPGSPVMTSTISLPFGKTIIWALHHCGMIYNQGEIFMAVIAIFPKIMLSSLLLLVVPDGRQRTKIIAGADGGRSAPGAKRLPGVLLIFMLAVKVLQNFYR